MVGPLQRGGCATLLTFKLSLRVMNYDGKHGKCHFEKSARAVGRLRPIDVRNRCTELMIIPQTNRL